MQKGNTALKIVQDEKQAKEINFTKNRPWALHRLIRLGPTPDIRCSNTAYTKEKGKESL